MSTLLKNRGKSMRLDVTASGRGSNEVRISNRLRRGFTWPVVAVIGVGIVALVSARTATPATAPSKNSSSHVAKETQGVGFSERRETTSNGLRRLRVGPKLTQTLRVLGDRLERPGNERLIAVGTLSRSGPQAEPHPFRLMTESGDRMRLEEQIGAGVSVITFDGDQATKTTGALERRDEDLIESLVFDTIEHFFAGQNRGVAIRALGERFRLDDGNALNENDHSYDIYEVIEPSKFGQRREGVIKLYFFNSDTLLLERVRHDVEGSTVEILLGDWRRVATQMAPHSITRIENGEKTMEVTISSMTMGPAADSGLFLKP